jgi:preprotein translocase subunit SecE
MDNRKLILSSYLVTSAVLWFISRSFIQWLYLNFYQIRRLPGIALARETLPVLAAGALFVFFLRNAQVNTVLDEVVVELKKVTWPNRDEVVKSTTVVIICILIASFLLAGFDLMWGKVITFLLNG